MNVNKKRQWLRLYRMTSLYDMKCEACRSDSLVLTEAEIETLATEVPGWSVVEVEGIKRIERRFNLGDFKRALRFTNQVGEIAEQQGHHPAILTEWGRVSVTYWTHTIGGLHKNDFIMAAKTDELFRNREKGEEQ